MILIKSVCSRIVDDFKQKKLMPLKLIFFIHTSTLHILYPYLTIHMRQLGINVEETAIMSAITPFVAIIMPPIAGMIADRIGNYKILLSVFSALGGAASLLLLLVPVGRMNMQLPDNVVLGANCAKTGNLTFSMDQKYPCNTLIDVEIEARLRSCGYECPIIHLNETDVKEILMSRHYQLEMFEPNTSETNSYNYNISETELQENIRLQEDSKMMRKYNNIEFYNTLTRQLSKNRFFFPILPSDFKCRGNNNICIFNSLLLKPARVKQNESSLRLSLKEEMLSQEDTVENHRRYLVLQENSSSKCMIPSESADVQVHLNNGTVHSDNCTRACIFTTSRKNICSNSIIQVEDNINLTFWTYLLIRVFIGMISGTSFAMFEGAVIAILREQKADYGLQRIYGSIGGMISSPLSGMLIDYASRDKEYVDFRPAFYLYAGLKILSGVLMLLINLEFKAPASNVISDVVSVLKNIEIMALLTSCFILGTAWGYIESFLFWLLEDLGASRSLMGITITVGGIAGIPLLIMSGPIISKIGHANVIFIGFIFYAIRLLGYSLINNPWQCLIFEALESVTSSLSFTAAVTYAAKLSTTTTDSSIQGLLGGIYYGVGKGFGSLIGGYLMKAFGTRPTYQIFSVVTLLSGLFYLLFNLMYLSKQPQSAGNDIVKPDPKPMEQSSIKDLEENKLSKENSAHEMEKKLYIEEINNAKNLSIVQRIGSDKNGKSSSNKTIDRNSDSGSEIKQRCNHIASDNPALVIDDE